MADSFCGKLRWCLMPRWGRRTFSTSRRGRGCSLGWPAWMAPPGPMRSRSTSACIRAGFESTSSCCAGPVWCAAIVCLNRPAGPGICGQSRRRPARAVSLPTPTGCWRGGWRAASRQVPDDYGRWSGRVEIWAVSSGHIAESTPLRRLWVAPSQRLDSHRSVTECRLAGPCSRSATVHTGKRFVSISRWSVRCIAGSREGCSTRSTPGQSWRTLSPRTPIGRVAWSESTGWQASDPLLPVIADRCVFVGRLGVPVDRRLGKTLLRADL